MSTVYSGWVGSGITVDARFADGDGSFGTGRVISYTDQPTLTIERADGSRFSWIANLCKPVDPNPDPIPFAIVYNGILVAGGPGSGVLVDSVTGKEWTVTIR